MNREKSLLLDKYFNTHSREIAEVVSLTQSPGDREPYSAIANVPVKLESETIEAILPTFASIGKAANQLNAPTAVMSWFNFKADRRYDNEKTRAMYRKARLADAAISEVLKDDNVRIFSRVDHQPARGSISLVRHRTHLGSIATLLARMPPASEDNRFDMLYHLPYFSVDADTTIGEMALKVTAQTLENLEALFVNGTLEYTGGVMDLPPPKVAELDTGSKSLYLSEHLRRFMFSTLEPTKQRGYRPETGLGCETGLIAALGGFNFYEEDSETYWLEHQVAERRKEYEYLLQLDPRGASARKKAMKGLTVPEYICKDAKAIGRYEDFPVRTSIRGIEAQVRKGGVNALVGFDQGKQYTLWSESEAGDSQNGALDTRKITFQEITHLVNGVYSYFVDCGGSLNAEGLVEFNQLFLAVFRPSPSDLQLGQLAWLPRYIDDKGRREI